MGEVCCKIQDCYSICEEDNVSWNVSWATSCYGIPGVSDYHVCLKVVVG